MAKTGVAIKAMTRELHMSRNTTGKYLHLQELPRRRSLFLVNIGDFDTYIRSRLKEELGIPLAHLYREIKQMGYNGGRISACLHLNEYVNIAPRNKKFRLPDIFYFPSKISYLLLRRKEQLLQNEQKLVANICSKCPQIKNSCYLEAVRNALVIPWSNGQVEGQIYKLKTIKRLMYRRASFEPLRKWLLLNSSYVSTKIEEEPL